MCACTHAMPTRIVEIISAASILPQTSLPILILAILLSSTESRPCGTFWRQLWRCNWLAWGGHVLHGFFRRLGPVRRKSSNCSWYRRLWQPAFSEIRHVEMAGLWLDLVDFSHLSLLAGFSSFVPTEKSNARAIHYLHNPTMQYGLGASLHKNNTSCLLLGLYHASVNLIYPLFKCK